MGIFGSIRNYFKSFKLSPFFHSHGPMRNYNNQQKTNKALLVQNMLTACCDIGQSLPDLVDVHRQIHFSSAETQLPKKPCRNTKERLNFSKARNAADLNKSDGGGWLALAQRGRGDPCHYHVLSVLTQILTFLVLAGRHLAWGKPVQRGERHLSLLLAIQVHLRSQSRISDVISGWSIPRREEDQSPGLKQKCPLASVPLQPGIDCKKNLSLVSFLNLLQYQRELFREGEGGGGIVATCPQCSRRAHGEPPAQRFPTNCWDIL